MAERRRYVLNLGIAGVGATGEVVECDPDLYAVWIEAGFISPADDGGARSGSLVVTFTPNADSTGESWPVHDASDDEA